MTPRDPEWINTQSTPDLTGRRLHFVGIGGCGMSGLARIARAKGAICTGSDMTETAVTEALVADGINVVLQQTADSVPADAELLVISAAIKPQHPEVAEAHRRNLPILKYAQLLGRLMIGRTGVAIAGTHGKSTTTAMLAHVLIQAELDPTFVVGATCEQIGGGYRVGRPDMLLAEACEYDRSFHNFHPTIAAVLNVEEDHLDIYGSLDGVVESFNHFAKLTDPDGLLLIGHGRANRTSVAAGVACEVQTIGFSPDADWAIDVDQQVAVSHDQQPVFTFTPHLPGEHMAYNASVAGVLAMKLGATPEQVGTGLTSFRGLDRRMQTLGEHDGVTVIDDYGHHPTEISTTLRALRRHHRPGDSGGRVICVFQPHQHSRTRFLLDQFATSFEDADVVIVPHIYFVRDSEEDKRAVSAADLVAKLRQRDVDAHHIDSFDDIVDWLHANARPGDLLVVMGAGPVWQVAAGFLRTS
jgi:UDP-N-acetylmuramate--alanine ligase